MRSHRIVSVAAVVGAVVALSWSATPRAQGRGANPSASLPTPKLADGTVNLGRVPGEKGYWNTPYITNMGARVIDPSTGQPFPLVQKGPAPARGGRGAEAPVGGGEGGGGGGGRGGASAEPFVPFQPWAAAVYDYNSKNLSNYDPEGYCLPPGGPRLMATPYPMEIIQLPEQKRVIMIFEGATHIWREIYMDGRPHPTGRRAESRPISGTQWATGTGDTLVVDVVGFNEDHVGRLLRPSAHRPAARRREVLASEQEHAALRSDDRRPGRLHEAVQRGVGHSVERRPAS